MCQDTQLNCAVFKAQFIKARFQHGKLFDILKRKQQDAGLYIVNGRFTLNLVKVKLQDLSFTQAPSKALKV